MLYIAPEIEVLSARVEKGFFLSSGTGEQLQEGEVVDNNNFKFGIMDKF